MTREGEFFSQADFELNQVFCSSYQSDAESLIMVHSINHNKLYEPVRTSTQKVHSLPHSLYIVFKCDKISLIFTSSDQKAS